MVSIAGSSHASWGLRSAPWSLASGLPWASERQEQRTHWALLGASPRGGWEVRPSPSEGRVVQLGEVTSWGPSDVAVACGGRCVRWGASGGPERRDLSAVHLSILPGIPHRE